jgi:hypothetical protein
MIASSCPVIDRQRPILVELIPGDGRRRRELAATPEQVRVDESEQPKARGNHARQVGRRGHPQPELRSLPVPRCRVGVSPDLVLDAVAPAYMRRLSNGAARRRFMAAVSSVRPAR